MLRHQQSVGPVAQTVGRPAGRATACTALVLIFQLAVLRALFEADEACVYVLGRPIHLACAVRARFGVPCPACGATRGVAMALHGHLRAAWNLFPAAPLVVCGVALLSIALLGLSWLERHGPDARSSAAKAGLRSASLTYALAASVVWLVGWIAHVRG